MSLSIYAREPSVNRPLTLGITFQDHTEFFCAEFIDTDRMSNLEAQLVRVVPTSVSIGASDKKLQKAILEIVKSHLPDSKITTCNHEGFSAEGTEADIKRLSCDSFQASPFSETALFSLAVLLSNERILSIPSFFGQCRFRPLLIDSFARLDTGCFTALNILPPTPSDVKNNTSLFGLLNKCRTVGGSRKLEQWLRQPLVENLEISARHDLVDGFMKKDSIRQKLPFSKVSDLTKIKQHFAKGTGNLEDLVRLFESVVAAASIADGLQELGTDPSIQSRFVSPIRVTVHKFEGFMRLVETCVDMEIAARNKFVIARSFDERLGSLAHRQDEIESKIEKLRSSIARQTGADSVRLAEAIQPFGRAFRVTKKQQELIIKHKELKQVQLNKAEYLFTCKDLEKLVEELMDTEAEYARVSAAIIAKAVKVASTYVTLVADLDDLISSVDVLAAFALVSGIWSLTRALHSDSALELVNARHVLVQARQIETGGLIGYIPNDISMSSGNLQVITGPNMGGKSTYIRTAGLCALLNQIGCFVPCDRAILPIFTAIHCRVGACDEQQRGVSTFMQEMLEASCILATADDKSLVLIDELGRGTSTAEGLGLAWAIAADLQMRAKAWTLFATHYLEMSGLPGAVNRHATALVNGEKITFLYQIKDGVAEKSYGPFVAKLAGYPEEVVRDAEMRLASSVQRG